MKRTKDDMWNIAQDTGSIIVALIMLWGVAFVVVHAVTSNPQETNTDPRKGRVVVTESSLAKYCDGTTLIYVGGRKLAVVPNSPECTK